jgi:uncharacterized protein
MVTTLRRVRSPRVLYLHGFASSRDSYKGRALEGLLAPRGIPFDRLDLRVPSLEHLRLSAILAATERAIDASPEPVLLAGSSLGGLTAALASTTRSVVGLVLLAPAFGLMKRWRARLGEAAWEAWQRDDGLEITDFATGAKTTVDFGFVLDAAEVASRIGDPPPVSVPTIVLHGTRDDVVPVEHSRAFAEGRANVRLVELDDDHELRASIDRIHDELVRAHHQAGVQVLV